MSKCVLVFALLGFAVICFVANTVEALPGDWSDAPMDMAKKGMDTAASMAKKGKDGAIDVGKKAKDAALDMAKKTSDAADRIAGRAKSG